MAPLSLRAGFYTILGSFCIGSIGAPGDVAPAGHHGRAQHEAAVPARHAGGAFGVSKQLADAAASTVHTPGVADAAGLGFGKLWSGQRDVAIRVLGHPDAVVADLVEFAAVSAAAWGRLLGLAQTHGFC